jgi:hypothetical protein
LGEIAELIVTTPVSPRGSVVDLLRTMWTRFPGLRSTLENTTARRELTDMLLALHRSPEHTIDQCLSKVVNAGYYVSEHAPAPARPDAPRMVAPEPGRTPSSLGTQAGKLLAAFYETGEAGLTAEEARAEAKLSPTSCFWKRVSELRVNGLIEYMLDEDDDIVRRPGLTSSPQQVCVITAYGRAVVTMLEDG